MCVCARAWVRGLTHTTASIFIKYRGTILPDDKTTKYLFPYAKQSSLNRAFCYNCSVISIIISS